SSKRTVQLVTNKDTEAPKGIGKLQIINLGDKNFIANETDYTKFLQEYSDNVTSTEKLKVYLAPNQDLESLVRNVGVSKFYVAIADEAGNVGNIEVPLFIKDDKVVFSSQNNFALRSNDIYINSLNYHQIETELSNFVRSKSEVKLWKLLPNQQGSLLDSNLVNINITNLPDKQIIPKSGDYIVPATYNVTGSTVTKNIKVSIADTPSVLNVQFINEANQVLQGYSVIINTKVGDTLNLTRNTAVQTQLRKITNAGYEIAKRPANETAVNINNTTLTVQYKLQGVLSLTSVPSSIDFGSLTYNATTKRVEDPVIDKHLIVTDTRADVANGWGLTATLTTPMKNGNGQELVNALRYVTGGKEIILNNNAQVVYINSKGTAGSLDVSDNWGKTANTDGIKLQINSSDTVYTGNYVGVITWKVMAGQP
ncbi:WxL domain-containing protein, partial [Enterococcus sp. 7D2_DIV0200]